MVDSDIIAQRLERIKNYVKQVRVVTKMGKKKAVKNDLIFAALERYLQLSVEGVLSCGNHIIAGLNLRKPATYDQIMQILAEEKIVNKKIFASCKRLGTLRTILVHDSSTIEREKIFDDAKDLLPVFEDVAKAYQKFL